MLHSNVVPEEKLRLVQKQTLAFIAERLAQSFGPYGSNSAIMNTAGAVMYTKDGKEILDGLMFNDMSPIEIAVLNDITDIARNVVKKVGDGTTTAAISANAIFKSFLELSTDKTPYDIIRDFQNAVEMIQAEILTQKKEFSAEKAYDITMISTNGNTFISETVRDLYERFGNDVFIDVGISSTADTYIKEYDGFTVESGYADAALINTNDGKCKLSGGVDIFIFDDPIDTPEMVAYLEAIISFNIYPYLNGKNGRPTAIFAPKLSRDLTSLMDQLLGFFLQMNNPMERPPLLICTNFFERDKFADIAQLSGAKQIKKYINPDQQKADIENGRMFTPSDVLKMAGKADYVEADSVKTKVINPQFMHDENGEHSVIYKNLIRHAEDLLDRAYKDGEDDSVKGKLKRRIQSLKCNLVELKIGGISMTDRDAVRSLVEDSVLNCRSAALNGYGYAASFETLKAIARIKEKSDVNLDMINVIDRAFKEVVLTLFTVSKINDAEKIVDTLVKHDLPYDVKTKEHSDKIISSIDTDICILDGVAKIVTLMFTANQFICPTVSSNSYWQKLD